MLGGFKINNTQLAGFGFNVTYDPIHNGTRTGLVTIDVRRIIFNIQILKCMKTVFQEILQ
jgi:hypothetical protein